MLEAFILIYVCVNLKIINTFSLDPGKKKKLASPLGVNDEAIIATYK